MLYEVITEATLEKDISDCWIYSDSLGNKFKFSLETWGGLINRYETDTHLFVHAVVAEPDLPLERQTGHALRWEKLDALV